MTALTAFDTGLTSNGEYSFPQLPPGSLAVMEIGGTFDSATVTLGIVNTAGTFTAIKDANRTNITCTAADVFEVRVPVSGRLAISVASVADEADITVSACIASN